MSTPEAPQESKPVAKIAFSFKETQPDVSTFYSRLTHFLAVTSTKQFLVGDKEILDSVKLVKKYKQMAAEEGEGKDKVIQITQTERDSIMKGVAQMNSNTNDVGELVVKPFRMCGFVPMNVPILVGILLSPPTIFNTMLFQWINQSYNAGLNYGNKNSTCEYTNSDLFKGYCAAIGSSITVAVTLRKMTAGLTKTATGKKLLLLNCMVGATAGGCASFCNTLCMRYAEIAKGITVFEDENLEKPLGISNVCAKSAVVETSLSRSAMSISSVVIPSVLILGLGAVGVAPQAFAAKTTMELSCITLALTIGLPLSVSIFPPISVKNGCNIEEKFKAHDRIYFSKGL